MSKVFIIFLILCIHFCTINTANYQIRNSILNQVKDVPRQGCPGQVIAFGQSSVPILTGQSQADLLIGATEFGKGRIVAIAHDGYWKHNDNSSSPAYGLLNNIKKWLVKGNGKQNSFQNMLTALKEGKLNQYAWVYYAGGGDNQYKSEYDQKIIQYIQNGGALFHLMCPWGTLSLNPGKTMADLPAMKVLEKAGLYYTSEALCSSTYNVVNNKANLNIYDALTGFFTKSQNLNQKLANILTQLPITTKLELRSKFGTYLTDQKLKGIVPMKDKPVTNQKTKTMMNVWYTFYATGEVGSRAAPGRQLFPGQFTGNPPKKMIQLSFKSKINIQDYHSTGYYARAGQTITISIIGNIPNPNWFILIGLHTDDLRSNEEWKRWPIVSLSRALNKQKIQIVSSFGGLIYVQNPKSNSISNLQIKLENVIAAPNFNLNNQVSIKNWGASKNALGLWADIVGKYITITLPSSSIRKLQNPSNIIQMWDQIVLNYHNLRGTDINKERRMWFVTDIQPSAGYMHSGYPIVTELDVAQPQSLDFLLSETMMKTKGSWGGFHQIGHNMQRDSWTYDGTGQVTNNVFTLYGMETVSKQKVWIHTWLRDQLQSAKDYLKNNDFENWKQNPGIALFVYAQIVKYFGWEVYKQVFRQYESNKLQLNTEQDKIDEWWARMSLACKRNLTPLLQAWGIPLSEKFTERVKNLEEFSVPNDEVTGSQSGHQLEFHHISSSLKGRKDST